MFCGALPVFTFIQPVPELWKVYRGVDAPLLSTLLSESVSATFVLVLVLEAISRCIVSCR